MKKDRVRLGVMWWLLAAVASGAASGAVASADGAVASGASASAVVASADGAASASASADGVGGGATFPFSFRGVSGGSGDDEPVVEGLPNAWAGGLNAAHVVALDLNGDEIDDLIVFDRNSKKPYCFVATGSAAGSAVDAVSGTALAAVSALTRGAASAASTSRGAYKYVPIYEAALPPLQEWVQAYDYNQDGRPDLFTFNGVAGVAVYRNVSHWDTDPNGAPVYRLAFELYTHRLQAKMYNRYGDLYCISVDYPALVDVDGDGAMDVLNFWVPSTGDYLHYYRNYALQTHGTLDSIDLRIEDWSWGCFVENEESNGIYLDSCRDAAAVDVALAPVSAVTPSSVLASATFVGTRPVASESAVTPDVVAATAPKSYEPKHSGSTLCALPRRTSNGETLYDLLLGDVGYEGLMYLYNGGSATKAHITAYDSLFPAENPIRQTSMPSVSVLPESVVAAMGWGSAATATDAESIYIMVSPYSTDAFYTQGRESMWVYELRPAASAQGGDAASSAGNMSTSLVGTRPVASAAPTATPAAPWQTRRLQTDFLQNGMIDHGQLSCPTFFDYNGDGRLDLVVGYAGLTDTSGGLALYENTGAAKSPAFRFVTDDFLGLKRDGLACRALCPAFGDYDGDGRAELVVGTFDGTLRAYGLQYEEKRAVGAVLRDSLFLGLLSSGNTAPAFFDVDMDGHLDLVVGCKQQMWTGPSGRRYTKSSLIYYRHTGRVDAATGHPFKKMTDSLGRVDVIDREFSNFGYARPAFYRTPSGGGLTSLVVGGENGCLKAYTFEAAHWQDTFACAGYLPLWFAATPETETTPEAAASAEAEPAVGTRPVASPAAPATALLSWSAGRHSAPALADLNADGFPELVIGNAGGGLYFAWGEAYRTPPSTIATEPHAAPSSSFAPLATLSPNPATHHVTLHVQTPLCYTLSDPLGRPCLKGRLSAGTHTLPLATLAPGLYILHLHTPITSQTLRLIKR